MANAQTHRSDPKILDRRTLERDHRALVPLLRPGMRVLDVGCGTGSITAGTARAVGPEGRVLGIDRDAALIDFARSSHAGATFEAADVLALTADSEFDVATAARALQWMADPGEALRRMVRSVKPGGLVVVLDYDHAENAWEPDPPESFQLFWRAFLDWRAANGWDNRMASNLPALMRAAGLGEIESRESSETATRGAPDFDAQAAIWHRVIETLGARVRDGGFLEGQALERARLEYGAWIGSGLRRQKLAMATVIGRRILVS